MTSGTRATRAADEQIKKVLEKVVSDSGLITDNRMAKFMADLEANLKSTLISEIEKVTKPLVNSISCTQCPGWGALHPYKISYTFDKILLLQEHFLSNICKLLLFYRYLE